ncbi:MAG: leucine-rich repeat protein [Capnocytophaga sp.]|uniref:leucine-rich repeat domain-containing protein n=1 Tax=Capnocytophaga sp. TaxID=44737 RepID=UPI003F9F36FD
MKKLFVCAMACFSVSLMVSCRKQVIEERTEVQSGSDIIRQNRPPEEADGKIGDYFINSLTAELYGPKGENGWGAPIQFGNNNTQEAKIHSGAGAPSPRTGNEGDWYIDLNTRKLYGPKTKNQWGEGIVLGGNPNNGSNADPDASLPDYHLNTIGQPTLLLWANPKTVEVNMNKDPKLKLVEVIGDEAFAQKRSLEKILIGDEVRVIGAQAFENNFGLKDILFTANSKLESVNREAFTKCNSLKTIAFPEGLTVINQGAFLKCENLEKAIIPGSCERILQNVFQECPLLKDVVLNEGIKLIDNEAFQKCASITAITFPKSLQGLGEAQFNETSQKISVTFLGDVPTIEGDPFAGATIEHIYVPSQFLQKYREAFTEYTDIIEVIK